MCGGGEMEIDLWVCEKREEKGSKENRLGELVLVQSESKCFIRLGQKRWW